MTDKDLRKVLSRYLEKGWYIKRGSKHYRVYHPEGGFVTVSSSAFCSSRHFKNLERDLKALERDKHKEKPQERV